MKRTSTAILALTLAATLFAGCSSTGGFGPEGTQEVGAGAAPAADTPEAGPEVPAQADEVVFYCLSFTNIPDSYDQVNTAINEHIAGTYPEANVKLKLQLFGPVEYEEKIRLAMQSGTPVDLFTPLGLANYVAQNQVLPLEDLLTEYGRDVTAIIHEDIGTDAFKTYEINGHTYGVPINKGMVVTPTLIYDKDMLAATGYSIDSINSLRDLPKVFDKIKELYPEVFPYANTNQGDTHIIPILAGENDIDVMMDRVTYMGVVFGDSGQVVNLYDTPWFAEYVGIMRDWYEKGYVPKDMATSPSTATEYFNAGRLFSTIAGYGGNEIGALISASTGRNIGNKWIAPFYFDSSAASLATAVSSTSKSPAAAMKMINILYTDEFVINTILYGIEGMDYVKVDEHHWTYPEGKDVNTVSYTAAFSTGIVGSEKLQLQTAGVSYEDVLLKLRQNVECKRSPYYGFTFDPSKVVNEITALNNVYSQYIPGLVCGSLDPAVALPEFNKALKDAGIDALIAEKQTQLNAWIAANR
ncbi:MAG: extracellular solute-binding protein [Clostridiales bacterium]|jgi:putative aldouronate transport system substrate-binding protein|nr:extracellular solute-binding protein [Clostridiales bacterium]